jgi:prohibitin 2
MSKSPFQGLMKAGGNLPAGGGFRLALGLGALGVGASTLAYSSIFTVEGGHKAIIFSRWSGILPQVYGEGWHLLIPGLHIPHVFNVRTRPTSIPSLTGSKDLQMVNITLRVLTKPKWEKLPQIYKKLGHDYDQRVLPSIVNEVLKGVVARFNAAQLITQRELVSGMIQDRLRERAADFYIDLDDVSITHLGFGREYTAAVEAKQVAQQEAERAKFIVEKAQQDKRGIIIRAEGDAQSAKMISEAIQSNPYYLELKTIEAARDIARSLANSQNKVYLNSEMLMFNLLGALGSSSSSTLVGAVLEAKDGQSGHLSQH